MSDIEIRRETIYNTETNYKELLQPPGFAKIDLLRIETNSEKLGNSKNHKLVENHQGLLLFVTFLT